ncbi:uncharacterized protein zgc:113363 [Hoplias malabaricus]|uniref:uncharacterized protein zgc:113363 n=1 Tax=Hoplias malabaricus TaxID=27720 RepID=UPI003462DC45
MDVQQQNGTLNSGKDKNKSCENHSNHITKTQSNAETVSNTVETDPPSAKNTCPNGIAHRGSDKSLNDIVVTSDDALLLPDHVPVIPHKIDKESPGPLSGPPPKDTMSNGSLPICTPPNSSKGQRARDPAQVPKCNGQHKKNRLHSTSKSQQSLKVNGTQIQQVAGDDCCVHCILACLFCEVASLCSALAQCLACGLECEADCCCGEACASLACCSEDPCSALLDCAIMEDCCQSSDCLEMCLDCCSICFPA